MSLVRFIYLAAGVLAVATASPSAAGDACIGDWSVAAPIVRKEGLMTVEQLTPRAKQKLKGDVVKVTLCQEKGGYVFRLVVRSPSGDLQTITVDAKNPF